MQPTNFSLLGMAPNTKRCRIIGLLLNWYESTTLFLFFQKQRTKIRVKSNFAATRDS